MDDVISIPNVGIRSIGINEIYIPNITTTVPMAPTVPFILNIGSPVVDLPGCVEFHPDAAENRENPNLKEEDSSNVRVLCDANMPSFDSMDYTPEDLNIYVETPPPAVQPPPDPPGAPEVPETGGVTPSTECPAPNQPRVGDLTTSGDEKVVGHELQGTVCVVLYEPTSAAEKFLPTANVVTTTATIAAVATASALFAKPLADLLLRLLKPAIKKASDSIKKKLGKKVSIPSRSLKKTNLYRQSKGLPPLKE